MADESMWKFFATLGVGGILAGVIFYFYNQRVTEWMKTQSTQIETEQRRGDALMSVVKENTASNVAVVKSVEANTRLVEFLYQREFDDNEGRRHHLRSPNSPPT